VRAVLRGQREDEVELPFRVSEQELSIIERQPSPPASLLLLGRSGTGKTTVGGTSCTRCLKAKTYTARHRMLCCLGGASNHVLLLTLPLPLLLSQVLVFRMFFRWLAKYHHSDQVHYQAFFVTASKTLKEQVRVCRCWFYRATAHSAFRQPSLLCCQPVAASYF
jgi:hypothetical protein